MNRSIIVFWDFGDTDLESLPYAEALRESGVPHSVVIPSSVEEYEIRDWLSDTYGFTHFGWTDTNDGLPTWTE